VSLRIFLPSLGALSRKRKGGGRGGEREKRRSSTGDVDVALLAQKKGGKGKEEGNGSSARVIFVVDLPHLKIKSSM